jgi:hypothetical protein
MAQKNTGTPLEDAAEEGRQFRADLFDLACWYTQHGGLDARDVAACVGQFYAMVNAGLVRHSGMPSAHIEAFLRSIDEAHRHAFWEFLTTSASDPAQVTRVHVKDADPEDRQGED